MCYRMGSDNPLQCYACLGSSKRFYSWESGIRIRGNLDILETWAMENGFATQSLALLAKISALANLLATPKDQLLKVSD